MSSMLSSFFSRDPRTTFPYELPTESFITHQDIFIGKSWKKSVSQEKATCFWSTSPSSILKAQAQKLKTLRHPNVLTFIDSLEVENTFYLITEPCRPLAFYLEESKLTETQRELLVSWGIYQLLNCLKFLHNEAKISQNNLKNAIFVTASGDWKLAAFHLSGSLNSPQTDLNDLATVLVRIFSRTWKEDGINNGPSAALQAIPKRLHPLFKQLNARGKSVMAASDLLNECRAVGGFMKNKFVDTLLFLDEFQIREAGEKQSFFVHLNSNLDLFPADIGRNKILPKLIHTYEYGDAGAHILVPMFKLGKLLEEEEYQQRIVPCLIKLFGSTDRTTRVKLLERIDEFAGHLKSQIVNEKIYSNLVTGFLDSNAAIRESTVKAMVVFAEKLNYNNLNTDLMKYLARLQGSDPEPSIRTNTTICLGKIGCFIDASHRQRILISAFTRALRDPFPPARMAGIIALSATQQYFSLAEVAQKVLPSLAPLTVDSEKQVREHAFKAMGGFLEKLQKASDNPELIPELEAQVKAGGRGGLLSGDKVPQWAGWAIKTISGKFYKSSGPSTTAKEQQLGERPPAEEEKQTAKMEENKGGGEMPPRGGSFSSSQSSISATPNSSSMVADGWGELMDDEEEGKSEDASDFGVGNGNREDALWSEETTDGGWESIREESSTPNSPKMAAGCLKLNPPYSLSSISSSLATENKQRQSQSPSPAVVTMKLSGTVKKSTTQPKKQQIDKDLDLLLGMDEEKPSTITSREGSEGNFATVANQISQQKGTAEPKQQQHQKMAVTSRKLAEKGKLATEQQNNWQDW